MMCSHNRNDEGMLSDMVVAVEDLGTVEFVMVSATGPQNGGRTRSEGATPPQASYELPMPHVSGNRQVSSLTAVLLVFCKEILLSVPIFLVYYFLYRNLLPVLTKVKP